MNCKKCGNILNENDKVCPSCGEIFEEPTDNTFMNTQPFSIDEVAQRVEENRESESIQTEAKKEPTVNIPESNTIEEPTIPTEPVLDSEPIKTPVKKENNKGLIIAIIVLGVIIVGLVAFIVINTLK